mgnify:FL=1
MPDIAFWGALLLFAEALLETTLSYFWIPAYFRWGVPIVQNEVLIHPIAASEYLPVDHLRERFQKDGHTPLEFERLQHQEAGFREQLFYPSLRAFLPLVHGRIILDIHSPSVKVQGHVNGFAYLLTPFVFFLIAWPQPEVDALPRLLALFAFLLLLVNTYRRQEARYAQVARETAKMLNQGHGRTRAGA